MVVHFWSLIIVWITDLLCNILGKWLHLAEAQVFKSVKWVSATDSVSSGLGGTALDTYNTEQSVWYVARGRNVCSLPHCSPPPRLYFDGVLLQGDPDLDFMTYPPLPHTLLFAWKDTKLFFFFLFHFALQLFIFMFKIIEQNGKWLSLLGPSLGVLSVSVLTKEITTSCFCVPTTVITAMVLRYFYCGLGVKIKCAG